jgi:hypothetical protein
MSARRLNERSWRRERETQMYNRGGGVGIIGVIVIVLVVLWLLKVI